MHYVLLVFSSCIKIWCTWKVLDSQVKTIILFLDAKENAQDLTKYFATPMKELYKCPDILYHQK